MSMSARNNHRPAPGAAFAGNGATVNGVGGAARLRAASLLLCVLCGCAVGPNFHRPEAPAATHYAHGEDPAATAPAQGTAQQFNRGAAVAADWWALFQSPQLDAVIKEAIGNNPGLAAAAANLRASQNDLRSGYGIFYPAINAECGRHARAIRAPPASEQKAPSSVFNLFTLSASVSYALDVFGGQRRLVEGLRAEVDVAQANERATYLALAANVVNTVVAARRVSRRDRSDATAHRTAKGAGSKSPRCRRKREPCPTPTSSSLQSQLASYEATIPQLEQKLDQSEDLLAALAGHPPAEWQAPPVRLADLTLPGALPVSLPSDLVRQRPDILAAEATAHAASANIGVATAALLPSVTLNGSYEALTNSTASLFPSNGRAWSVGASATAPLFEGGTLWFKRKAAIDQLRSGNGSISTDRSRRVRAGGRHPARARSRRRDPGGRGSSARRRRRGIAFGANQL